MNSLISKPVGFREGILKRMLRYGADRIGGDAGSQLKSERFGSDRKGPVPRIATGDGVSQELGLLLFGFEAKLDVERVKSKRKVEAGRRLGIWPHRAREQGLSPIGRCTLPGLRAPTGPAQPTLRKAPKHPKLGEVAEPPVFRLHTTTSAFLFFTDSGDLTFCELLQLPAISAAKWSILLSSAFMTDLSANPSVYRRRLVCR